MNGIIILNKPAGCTSFEAVRSVSRLFSREKAGHTGTLDPMATGVLPVLLGRATKLNQYLPETGKSYIATVVFGVQTDTGDFEGRAIAENAARPNREAWENAVRNRVGKQLQVPPMYSALKKDGKPLYELARRGETVDRTAREIEITELQTLFFDGNTARIQVSCSAGTYIRTLAEDLAADCGCLAHLTALQRTAACGFSLEEAVTLEELSTAADPQRYAVSLEKLFAGCPYVRLSPELARLFLNGFVFPAGRAGLKAAGLQKVCVYREETFIGLGCVDGEGLLKKLWQTETV